MKKFDYREELRLIGMPAGMGLCLASIETVLDAMTTSTTSHEEILYITTEMTLDEVKEQMLEEAVKLVSGINISDAECSGLTLADKIKIDMVRYSNEFDEVLQEICNRGCTGHIGYQLPRGK